MVDKTCERCGKAFSVRASNAAERRFCSKDCKHQANRVTLTCKGCGKTWWTWASQLRISGRPGAGQFCSRQCADLAKIKPKPEKPKRQPSQIYRACEVCDRTFRIWPSRQDTARFCSKACMRSSAAFAAECSKRQQGEKSWRWTGGKYKTGEGYIRLKRSDCGVEVFRFEHTKVMVEWLLSEAPQHPFLVDVDGERRLHPDVEVHHIDRVRSNNGRANLLAVTSAAHALIHHKGRKPEPWECWPTNPTRW